MCPEKPRKPGTGLWRMLSCRRYKDKKVTMKVQGRRLQDIALSQKLGTVPSRSSWRPRKPR